MYCLLNREELNKAIALHNEYYKKNSTKRAIDQLSEELCELVVAILHHKRGEDNTNEIEEEMADVLIAMEMVGRLVGADRQRILSWVHKKSVMFEPGADDVRSDES